jgi:hypothetical protein
MAAPAGDFSWPDFDRWQVAFDAAGIFPARWAGLERPPAAHSPDAAVYQLQKRALFDEWLDLLAHRAIVQAHYARRGIRARVARQDERTPCPACEPFNAREAGPDLDTMPPFHPGCRCVLVAAHPSPAVPRTRPYERPRPRAG